MDDKRPGFRLMSQLNRTNSDSALHTSVMNPPDAFGPNQNQNRTQSRVPQRNTSLNEAEDGAADVFSFPPLSEDAMMGTRLLPKQLWDTQQVQSLRPKSCEVPGINIFPSTDPNVSVPQYQPCQNSSLGSGVASGLNTGGSLPDLTNLQFPPPLSTPIDSDENYTNHLPHAMMQMGLSSSLSNPSLCSSPRRRPAPISPLTLSPEQQRGVPPLSQGVPLDPSLPREPPPPYPHYPQSHSAPGQQQSPLNSPLQQGATLPSPSAQSPQNLQNLQNLQKPQNLQNLQTRHHQNQSQTQGQGRSPLDYGPAQVRCSHRSQNMSLFGSDPFVEPQFGPSKSFQESFGFLDGGGGNCSFDPSSSSSLFYNSAPQHGLQGNASSMQMSQGPSSRPPMLFPQAALPNIILTDDSVGFSLEDELRIEPLTLDGLSMLSDPELVLPDPTVEESFRSDRL
ncbi:hypothetical protein NL108_017958 [Boleophthalmus pectinirostris]|nr:hypothetical protein NL108_017958 [Boleophthalmus pectinirostris]